MWLREFLPEDLPNTRVMAFNHNTRWEANALSKSLQDYGEDLLRALRRKRQTPEVVLTPWKRGGNFTEECLLPLGDIPTYHFYRSQLWRSYNQTSKPYILGQQMKGIDETRP